MFDTARSWRVAACAALALGLLSATVACGATGTPTRCSSGDDPVLINAVATIDGGDDLQYVPLILECGPDGTVVITDEGGNEYESLEDFQANNDLLTEDDQMLIPADFPSMDESDQAGFTTVAGHTGNSALWWWIGAVALVAVIALIVIARIRANALSRLERRLRGDPAP